MCCFSSINAAVDEEHIAVLRQRPARVVHVLLQFVDRLAEGGQRVQDVGGAPREGHLQFRAVAVERVQSAAKRAGNVRDARRALLDARLFGRGDGLADHAELGGRGGLDEASGHLQRGFALNEDLARVFLHENTVAALQFCRTEHAGLVEELQVLRVEHGREGLGRGVQVGQAAPCGFLHPGLGVAVAVEDNALVVLEDGLNDLLEAFVEALFGELGDGVGQDLQALGHDGVQRHADARAVVAGARRAELELVAGEGEGARAVAVGRVARQGRQGVDADAQGCGVGALGPGTALDAVDDLGQLVTQEDGEDGGRGFIGTQTVIVARACRGRPQDVGVQVNGTDDAREHGQEDGVLLRVLAGVEQVFAVVGHGPVVVLARAVHAREGFLM